MQKTANEIKSEFELLASGHYQIHSFLYAQEFEQQAYENLIYPLMLVYPLGGNLSGTSYTRNYRVVIADRVLKSEGNELEVESDTQLIALDTLAYWMKLGTNERFSITSSNTITPFWEKWGDEVTGHFVDIGIEEFYDFNSCAIPLSSAIPSPTNPCKDARILINSVIYGNAPSDSNFNVVVKNQSGTLVGSLIGGEWIVNTGAGCLDATYTITNSTGTTLYTGTIPSGGSLTQAISNSTLNVNNSAGTLISSRSILAQGTSSYNVADSIAVIKDSLGTTLKSENILATASENITINDSSVENSDATYSVDVLAEGSLILPDSQINVNSVDKGDVVSVKTIDVNLEDSLGAPVVPTSVGLVGNTLTIEVPSGATPMNVDFSADKLTALQGENITFTDLSDQSPTHWSWRFSDGTTSIVQNPVKSFLTTGLKNITLLAGKIGAGGVNIKTSYIEILLGFLLDVFPNAAAAYSLRKLRSGYTGSAIRVRRSSDNTEQDIGFNGSNGLDTTSLLSFVGAGNGFVVTWYDQSGNSRNVTQTTAANQPEIVSSGVIITNGTNNQPAISFNNKSLVSASFIIAQPVSKIQVFKYNSVASSVQIVSDNAITTNQLMGYNGTSHWMSGNSIGATYGTRANNTPYIISSLFNGASSSSLVNTTNHTPLNVQGSNTDGIKFGLSFDNFVAGAFVGNLSEFIIYGNDSSSNFSSIHTNINTYYGIF
jgi:PKD repeat protein